MAGNRCFVFLGKAQVGECCRVLVLRSHHPDTLQTAVVMNVKMLLGGNISFRSYERYLITSNSSPTEELNTREAKPVSA
jgi:hypothetical protein